LKTETIRLQHVLYMPGTLEPGILYISKEFGTAAHLCACGCGSKVRTPLGPAEWSLTESPRGPSLHPSIGNWQIPCQSHYWIDQGNIRWAEKWTPEQIAMGRRGEEAGRRAYYDTLSRQQGGPLRRLWRWVIGLFD
jgi:hypothetical protein